MSQGGRWRRGKCVRGCMPLPCKGRVTKLSNSSCDKAVVRCSMVVVGQPDQVSMRRTNVGEREIHAIPLDSEQVYKRLEGPKVGCGGRSEICPRGLPMQCYPDTTRNYC